MNEEVKEICATRLMFYSKLPVHLGIFLAVLYLKYLLALSSQLLVHSNGFIEQSMPDETI